MGKMAKHIFHINNLKGLENSQSASKERVWWSREVAVGQKAGHFWFTELLHIP